MRLVKGFSFWTQTHFYAPTMTDGFIWKALTDSRGGTKHIHHEANWCKRAVGGQRFSVADGVAIIWMSYNIQPDPINMPLDRRASHQPNLENQ